MTIADLRVHDLNLLVVLFVLLEEKSVTNAAKRLGRSQSAVSHALGRLRELFDDPLLVRADGSMQPTPLAESLAPQLTSTLSDLTELIEKRISFDASLSQRKFRLVSPDAITVAVGPLVQWFETEAPLAQLSLGPISLATNRQLQHHALDLVISRRGILDGATIRARGLGRTRLVSFLRNEHSMKNEDLQAWLAARHVVVISGDGSANLLEQHLRDLGHARGPMVEVPNFLAALATVAKTDAIFTGPDFMAEFARETFGLRAVSLPIAFPGIELAMYWHQRWHDDEAHRWFREGVFDCVQPRLTR